MSARWTVYDACLLVAGALLLFALLVARHRGPFAPLDAHDHADCGCPAPSGTCVMPCSGCCDDPKTPEAEPCPCENPTSGR